MGVVVRADAPWRTCCPTCWRMPRANPGNLNWGTLGIGSTHTSPWSASAWRKA